jgi:hypothetical protein
MNETHLTGSGESLTNGQRCEEDTLHSEFILNTLFIFRVRFSRHMIYPQFLLFCWFCTYIMVYRQCSEYILSEVRDV